MKNILFAISISMLFISNLGLAQAPNVEWAKRMGGVGEDHCFQLAVDDSGNVYSTGDFEGTGDFNPGAGIYNLTSAGQRDIYINKMDSDGNFIWAKRIGGLRDDYANSIALDDSGNMYITGAFASTVDFDPGSGTYNLIAPGITSTNIFFLKLNNSGNLVWAETVGAFANDIGNYISVDSVTGELYACGTYTQTVDFDPGTDTFYMTPASMLSAFVIKLTNAGDFIWAKQFTGMGVVYAKQFVVDQSTGNIYLTGVFTDTIDFDPGTDTLTFVSNGDEDIYVLKLSSQGNLIWANQCGGTHTDNGYSIDFDPAGSGSIYFTGDFRYTVDFDPGPGTFIISTGQSFSIYVCKLDTAGNFIWAFAIAGISTEVCYAVRVDPAGSGDIYMTGHFYNTVDFDPGPDIHNLVCQDYTDIFVCRFDSGGNYKWAKSMGGNFYDESICLTLDARRQIYVGGYFWGSYFNADGIVLTNSDNSWNSGDLFIIKIGGITSSTIYPLGCYSYTSPSGNYTWTSSGIYYDTIPNGAGFDSLMTIHLTISNNTFSAITTNVCDSFPSPDGTITWTTSGIYIDTIPNNMGCDSIITINLTVNYTSSSSDTITICNSYLSPSGNVLTTTGIYYDTLINAGGCDSVITTDLIVNYSASSFQSISTCGDFVSPGGTHVWTHSGIYNDTIPAASGCDSVITIDLTITNIDTVVITSGYILTAFASSCTYQWLNCDNGFSGINGATNKQYISAVIGTYAVVVTQNGCTDTSGCHTVTVAGINNIDDEQDFILYPNPTSGQLSVVSNQLSVNSTIVITNTLGEVVQTVHSNLKSVICNLQSVPAGIYIVHVRTENGSEVRKVVKE